MICLSFIFWSSRGSKSAASRDVWIKFPLGSSITTKSSSLCLKGSRSFLDFWPDKTSWFYLPYWAKWDSISLFWSLSVNWSLMLCLNVIWDLLFMTCIEDASFLYYWFFLKSDTSYVIWGKFPFVPSSLSANLLLVLSICFRTLSLYLSLANLIFIWTLISTFVSSEIFFRRISISLIIFDLGDSCICLWS